MERIAVGIVAAVPNPKNCDKPAKFRRKGVTVKREGDAVRVQVRDTGYIMFSFVVPANEWPGYGLGNPIWFQRQYIVEKFVHPTTRHEFHLIETAADVAVAVGEVIFPAVPAQGGGYLGRVGDPWPTFKPIQFFNMGERVTVHAGKFSPTLRKRWGWSGRDRLVGEVVEVSMGNTCAVVFENGQGRLLVHGEAIAYEW